MARPRNKVIDYLVYLLTRLVAMLVYMAEPTVVYAVARFIGNAIYRIDKRHRKMAMGHLRLSFPNWSDEQVARCARRSMQNLVMMGLEFILTPRLITPARWARHIHLRNLGQTLRLLLERKSGIIMLTGHYGGWEIAGYTMATLGFPSVAVFRPLDNPHLNEFVMGIRERTGQSLLFKKGATRNLDEILDDRQTVCFIADQDAGRKGLFVDFFGRPASTYKTIALMARRHNTPVVVGYARRISDRFEFEVGIERVIMPDEWAGKEDEVRWLTQTFTTELENVIRRAPEQYLWLHRRWKHRPDGTRVDGLGVA